MFVYIDLLNYYVYLFCIVNILIITNGKEKKRRESNYIGIEGANEWSAQSYEKKRPRIDVKEEEVAVSKLAKEGSEYNSEKNEMSEKLEKEKKLKTEKEKEKENQDNGTKKTVDEILEFVKESEKKRNEKEETDKIEKEKLNETLKMKE
jgi:hypothetical protein